MNYRIRELIEKATSYTWNGNDVTEELDEEKFADLIVRECIKLIEEESVRLCKERNSLPGCFDHILDDYDLEIDKCNDLAERMGKHFGVEE